MYGLPKLGSWKGANVGKDIHKLSVCDMESQQITWYRLRLPETNILVPKNGGWQTTFLFGKAHFREGIFCQN